MKIHTFRDIMRRRMWPQPGEDGGPRKVAQ